MAAKQSPIGTFASIPLSILDEDPHQARTAFDAPALEQLTESIRAEGVKCRCICACERRVAWRMRMMTRLAKFLANPVLIATGFFCYMRFEGCSTVSSGGFVCVSPCASMYASGYVSVCEGVCLCEAVGACDARLH